MRATHFTRRPSQATQPVTGRLGRVRCRGYAWLVVLAFLTPRRIVAAILTASAGTAGVVATTDRQPPPVTAPAPEPQPVMVKHPLPEGVTETDVQKWVPNRRVSGRTELKPWQSVDAARARNPEVLRKLLHAAEPESALDQTADQERAVETPRELETESLREARRRHAAEIGLKAFCQLDEMLSRDGDTSAG